MEAKSEEQLRAEIASCNKMIEALESKRSEYYRQRNGIKDQLSLNLRAQAEAKGYVEGAKVRVERKTKKKSHNFVIEEATIQSIYLDREHGDILRVIVLPWRPFPPGEGPMFMDMPSLDEITLL